MDRDAREDFYALTLGITSFSPDRLGSSIVNSYPPTYVDESVPGEVLPTYYHIKSETFDRLGFGELYGFTSDQQSRFTCKHLHSLKGKYGGVKTWFYRFRKSHSYSGKKLTTNYFPLLGV